MSISTAISGLKSKLVPKTEEEIAETPKETFPEDSFTPEQLVRALREELGQQQATVNTSFRERQRQTVINELVAERNEARDKAISTRVEVGAAIAEEIFRVINRDGLLTENMFKAVAEGMGSAISAQDRMRLDEDDINTDALGEVFTKYHEILKNGPSEAVLTTEPTIESALQNHTDKFQLPATSAVVESAEPTETASSEEWADFVAKLTPKSTAISF